SPRADRGVDRPPQGRPAPLRETVAPPDATSAELNAAQVGRRERVLIPSRARRREAQLLGRTDGFKAVILPRGDLRPGHLVDVVIERSTMATLFGRVVQA